jgi:hypothetical protein
MFLRFVDFWEEYKPTLIETEVHLFSDELKVAGTCDMVCEINGEFGLLTLKHQIIYKQHMIYKLQFMVNAMKNVLAKKQIVMEYYG